MIKSVSFKNKRGLLLQGIIHIPRSFRAAVVFCHGFPSSTMGSTSRRIGSELSLAGFLVFRFTMSHTPPSEGKFEDKLMSTEVEDIKAAVDFVSSHFIFKQLVLYGHSTGAIDAALYAHRDRRIHKLILTGAVADLKNAVRYDFTDEQVKEFWTKGYIVYRRRGEWVDGKRLRKRFYDEFFTLDIPRAIRKFKRPLLIVHGEKDAIPYEREAFALYQMANRPKKFVLIKGADHSFHGRRQWEQVMRHIISFIKK